MVPGFKVCDNANYLNMVCNAPEVKGSRTESIDVSSLLSNGIAYQFDGGAIIYVECMPGVYEAHTQALKSGRGNVLREFIAETLKDIFLRLNAEAVISYAEEINKPAKRLASEFLEYNGFDGENHHYKLTRDDYLCRLQN